MSVFVFFVKQHAKYMRHIFIFASLDLPVFLTLSQNQNDFRRKLLNIKYVF
jgi:hypothetical protein